MVVLPIGTYFLTVNSVFRGGCFAFLDIALRQRLFEVSFSFTHLR